MTDVEFDFGNIIGEVALDQANEEIELLKADNTLKDLKITIQYDKIKKLEANQKEILEYCRKNTHIMWAARIVSIILDCDFRDAEYYLHKIVEHDRKNGAL